MCVCVCVFEYVHVLCSYMYLYGSIHMGVCFCALEIIPVQVIVSDHLIYQSLWRSIYFFHHYARVTEKIVSVLGNM